MSKSSVLSILNPFAENPPAPEWFTPFGDRKSAKKYNKKAFQVATLVPLYALLGMALRGTMNKRSEELAKLEKTGPIATAMTSSVASDLGKKQAGDLLYQSTAYTVPLGAALASLLVGMKLQDRKYEKEEEDNFNAAVEKLERQYNNELAKRLYPNAKKKMPTPSKLAYDYANKEAGIGEDLIASLGIMKVIAPAALTIALASGYASKKYFDSKSSQRKKAKDLKAGLEAHARTNWIPKMELPGDEITGDITV